MLGASALGMGLSRVSPKLAQQFVANTLGRMPGIPAKLSQLVQQQFGWQDVDSPRVAPLPWPTIAAMLQVQAPALFAAIDEVDEVGKVASIGQVHWARLLDGREAAIKVRFPGVADAVASSIDALMMAARNSPAARFGFDVEAYREFLQKHIGQELDYAREAAAQRDFAAGLSHLPLVVVPEVYSEFCTPSILVQSFEPAMTIAEAGQVMTSIEAASAMHTVMTTLATMLFSMRCLHSDPHTGNWGWRRLESGEWALVLYDFGSTCAVDREHARLLAKWLRQAIAGESIPVFDYLVFIGFSPQQLAPIATRLPAICERLLEPWIQQRPTALGRGETGESLKMILGEEAWWFRTAGPPWFLYLMRAVSGFTSGLSQLPRAGVITGKIIETVIAEAQLDDAALVVPDASEYLHGIRPLSSDCARWLRVLVQEHGRDVVSTELPSRAVDNLSNMIPEDVRLRLGEAGVDLEAIRVQAIRSGYRAQQLFSQQLGQRSYRVWLD